MAKSRKPTKPKKPVTLDIAELASIMMLEGSAICPPDITGNKLTLFLGGVSKFMVPLHNDDKPALTIWMCYAELLKEMAKAAFAEAKRLKKLR